jgi:hypothetical protein
MDERYAFLGHELCSPGTSYVYSLPSDWNTGDPTLDSSAWFHPNVLGQTQIATDLADYWQELQNPTTTQPPATGWQPPAQSLPIGIPTTSQAKTMLASLATVSAYPTAVYDPTGTGWVTLNGCSTRNNVLRAQALTTNEWSQAQPLTPANGSASLCPVNSGAWSTPYDLNSAAPTTPVFGNYGLTGQPATSTLPIDHLVPLQNAWNTGVSNWQALYGTILGQTMFGEFANDRGGPELLVVSNSSNSSKGGNAPQAWLPNNTAMYCSYVQMWIAVKWDWNLQVSTVVDGGARGYGVGTTELGALQGILNGCS